MRRATRGESRVDAALARLVSPPTNAPIEQSPGTGSFEPWPKAGPPALAPGGTESAAPGWWRSDALRAPEFWHRLARAYSDGLDTPHRAVGGACGLQHYAGRFALATVGVWVQTGWLLPMDHSRWWLRLNDRGHTTAVSIPDRSGGAWARSVDDAADALLTVHLRPVVDAVRAATRITDRVAFGCIAASCAGAFAALHRRCGVPDRARLRALAEEFLRQPAWPTGAPLVRLAELELDMGTALVHERSVCCLIRLGKGHGTCASCPDIDAAERAQRIRRGAAAAVQAQDLPLAVRHAGG